uniref:Ion transport domain-containing protein n=1 Tax=Amorphochlora amoebiformis TaxID=1561963 RepID=A0A7S0DP12_9EUKA
MGCIPVFIGFVLCALSMFSQHTPNFRTFDTSVSTFWAVMNGDWLFDNFGDSAQFFPVLSRFFFYAFMILFITVISKLSLSFVEFIFFKAMPQAVHIQKQDVSIHNGHHAEKENPSEPSSIPNITSLNTPRAENPAFRRRLQPVPHRKSSTAVGMLLEHILRCQDIIRSDFEALVKHLELKYPRFEYETALALNHTTKFSNSHIRCPPRAGCTVCGLFGLYNAYHLGFKRGVFRKMKEFCRICKEMNERRKTVATFDSARVGHLRRRMKKQRSVVFGEPIKTSILGFAESSR